MAALAVALPLATALGIVALARFEWFVLAVLLVRPALDGLQTGTALEPGASVGLLFLVAGGTWLAVQHRAGALARPSAPVIALCGLAVAASLSAIGSDTPAASATATLKIAAGVLMFVVIEQLLIQRREFARDLATAFAVSLVLPGIAAVAQMFTGSGFGDELGLNRLRGTFVHPNPFATYLVMLLLFSLAIFPSLAGARRWLLLATAATSGVLLVLTYTRAAWIAAVAGMAFLAWKQRPKLLWLIPAGVLLLLVLAPSILQRFSDLGTPDPVPGYPANSAGWRAAYWQELLPEGIKSPVTGLGIDSVRLTSADGRMPHNLFVQSWVEMGLLGLFAALTVIVVTVIFTRRRLRAAEPGPDRALALAAAAVGLSLLVQMPSENLLTQGIVYWYGAVSLTIGYERRQVRRPLQMPVRP
jgi:O-antigen ligase